MVMNIAFDSMANHFSSLRGIGKYAYSFIDALIEAAPENNYYLFDPYGDYELDEIFAEKNIRIIHFFFGPGAFLAEDKRLLSRVVERFCREFAIDAFILTSPMVPLPVSGTNWVLPYTEEPFRHAVAAALLYDLIPNKFPRQYLSDGAIRTEYKKLLGQYKWVDLVLSDSKSAADDLKETLPINEGKICVVGGAPDRRFRPLDVPQAARQTLYAKYGLKDHFILSVSGDDFRKNLDGLVSAYCALPRHLIDKYQLVVMCRISDESKQRLCELIGDRIRADRVIFTGYVTDEESLQLYNLAALMAFPSLYEGFGLPVVEAWACNTPVLTGDNSSLREVAGDGAVLVDAASVPSIRDGLRRALEEEDLPRLVARGRKRLELFTWERAARRALDAVGASVDAKRGKTLAAAKNEPSRRIAVFTPLPQLRSGIADYSFDVIGELRKDYAVDVFVDDGYEPNVSFGSGVRVLNHRDYRKADYDRTLFQVGNSFYHCYMWPYIRRGVDIIVLHDVNLCGALFWQAEQRKETQLLASWLAEDFGPSLAAEICRNPPAYEETLRREPVNGFLVNYARSVIVHSRYAKEQLLRRDIARRVEVIPHYANLEPPADARKVKACLGIDAETLLVAVFGHVQPTKRIVPIVKAFAEFRKAADRPARLFLVGQPAGSFDAELHALIAGLGLDRDVYVTGYTDLDEFTAYMDAADICLNLRYPYNGETSGALMRLLAKGKCAIVSDVGSFSELPDDACYKLPSPQEQSEADEVGAIAAALDLLAENARLRLSIARRARAYVEENLSLDAVGRLYRSVIEAEPTPALLTENDLFSVAARVKSLRFDDRGVRALSRTLAYALGAGPSAGRGGLDVEDLLRFLNAG